jgi:transposase
MLARLGVASEPPVRPLPSPVIRDLKQLNLTSQALIRDGRRPETGRLSSACRSEASERAAPPADRGAAARRKEGHRHTHRQSARTGAPSAILTSIPGVAKINACAMLIEMPEMGCLDGKQAASLAGLEPIARQSGRWTRPCLHPRRPPGAAQSPLHASPSRRPLQSGPQSLLPKADRRRKAS